MSDRREPGTTNAPATRRPVRYEPGFRARLAVEADGPALAELERRVPIELADHSIRIDRDEDYFAASRLMESPVVALGEIDGRVVCSFAGAVQPVRIGGCTQRLMIAHHARVLPQLQGKGLWRAASRLVFERLGGAVEGTVSYVAQTNAAGQRVAANSRKWSFPILRALINTHEAGAAGNPAAATALSDDRTLAVVETLNACHASEEGYVPYTPSSFRRRLARAPAQYGPAHVWRRGRAAIGVWPAGPCLAEIHERGPERRTHRQGRVFDYGYLPGGEADLVALLRAWCRHLDGSGHDQLAIFTSEASPGHTAIAALAEDFERFDLCLAAPEPVDAARRGWYVDAASF